MHVKNWFKSVLIIPKLLLLLSTVFIGNKVFAHDFWINASDYQPSVNTKVDFDIRVGMNFLGNSLPRIDNWFSRFEMIDDNGLKLIDGELGDDPAGSALISNGYSVVIYRSKRKFVELEPKKFKNYLRDEGLDKIIEKRRLLREENKPGQEWFSRCAKTLVKPIGTTSRNFDHDFNMTMEIIPLQDPYSLQLHDSLKVQVKYLGKPLVDTRLVAINASNPKKKIHVNTDSEGRADITLSQSGEWMIKAVHMIRETDNDDVDWESFWASLTFKI